MFTGSAARYFRPVVARVVSDMVDNPEDRFYHDTANPFCLTRLRWSHELKISRYATQRGCSPRGWLESYRDEIRAHSEATWTKPVVRLGTHIYDAVITFINRMLANRLDPYSD